MDKSKHSLQIWKHYCYCSPSTDHHTVTAFHSCCGAPHPAPDFPASPQPTLSDTGISSLLIALSHFHFLRPGSITSKLFPLTQGLALPCWPQPSFTWEQWGEQHARTAVLSPGGLHGVRSHPPAAGTRGICARSACAPRAGACACQGG